MRLTFIHVVNHREPKGTQYILDTMNTLRLRGLDFEFIFAERLEQPKAFALYNMADVLVEQLILGWYGAQAVELMHMGKIVVSNYISPDALKKVPAQMIEDCPILHAEPDTLGRVLTNIMDMTPTELDPIRFQGPKYVEKYHDPVILARQIIQEGEDGYTITHE